MPGHDLKVGGFGRTAALQTQTTECYVRGLMLDGKRTSIEPMPARLADGDEQCSQQLVGRSPWDEVWRFVARSRGG